MDPGGPAGSSRSSRPRCTASSAVSATSSLVTEAQRNGWAAGPTVSITPAAEATPTAAVTGQDAT